LQTRYTKAIAECARLSSLQIVNHDLGAMTKALLEIKDVLDGLQELIEHFIIFDRTEAVFLDENADYWLKQAKDCFDLERTQDVRLGNLEAAIERLSA
jgi:hypothetical protein